MGQVKWHKRRPRWWVLLLGVVLAGVSAVLGNSGSEWWILAAIGALGALGSEWKALLNSILDRSDDRRALLDRATTGRKWPKVRDTTPSDFGARTSLYDVEYQPRARVERQIRDALRCGQPVLIVEPSMVGKSRVAAEVLHRGYSSKRLCRPMPPSGLAELLAHGTPTESVVFLDDLERHLGSETLHPDWFRRLVEPKCGNVVVGTIRSSAMERFQATGDIRHPHARAVQETFTHVLLVDTEASNAEVASGISNPAVAAGVRKYGIGTYLGGGHRAMGRLREGADGHPLGVAMVHAASAWRLTGLDSIEVPKLQRLAREFLVRKPGARDVETDDSALTWATAVEDEVVRLLEPVGSDRVRCSDYVHDQLTNEFSGMDGDPRAIPWESAAKSATSTGELLQLAIRAYEAGHRDLAKSVLGRVMDGQGPNAGAAAYNLGVMLADEDDLNRARSAYQAAISAGQRDFDLLAAVNLGVIDRRAGDHASARAAYEYAINAGHEEQTPMALANLGNLEVDLNNVDAARSAYEAAMAYSRSPFAFKAALGLGELERKEGNLVAARAAYERATQGLDPNVVAEATLKLGDLGRDSGDLEAAKKAYTRAVSARSPESEAGLIAAISLAKLEKGIGDLERSKVLLQMTIDSEHPNLAPVAAAELGLLEAELGNAVAARDAYKTAIASDRTGSVIPLAAFNLGILEQDLRNTEEARKAYQIAMGANHQEIAAVAAFNLGGIEQELGHTEAARRAYSVAVKSADPGLAGAARTAMDALNG